MIDIHCHILYDVDDGSRSPEESIAMLDAAKEAGIDRIITTPHLRSRRPDPDKIAAAFQFVEAEAKKRGIQLYKGYESHYRMLAEMDMDEIKKHCLAGTNTILLEFSFDMLPPRWETHVVKLQRGGLNVIIAHPERYEPIQKDPSIAERMVEINCELQLDASSLFKGVFSKERKCALDMLKKHQISYIASDAHYEEHYDLFARAMDKYGDAICECEYLCDL